jgi:hypothetical protein
VKEFSSFVAPGPNHESQIDLFFMSDLKSEEQQRFKIGMCAIDAFTRFLAVVPIKSKSESGSINHMFHPNDEFFASKANPPGLRLTQARKASLANPPKVFTKPHGGRSRRRKTRRRKTRHRR